ncbi:MAG TPA: 4-(cytidine 5'-diphospho)-2-C-methyl-D-erythritol kinase [Hyphomicrobiaceae bacterium]|jgi:4-diphosphocytidyl-2-C-methyl-D-erythritol kinase
MPFSELARAKVNLTLTVLGRRLDGYHDITSLVAFADVGDRVTLHVGPDRQLRVCGPFAGAIEGPNLLDRALDLLWQLQPDLQFGTVELEKSLPVAAGLGGGSADAAALLRAVRRANPKHAASIDWHSLAARLGADVPVCLAGKPAVMTGIGDRVEPLAPSLALAPLACVLVNPRVPLPTRPVFAAFDARADPALQRHARRSGGSDAQGATFFDVASLLTYMRDRGNDLEPAATSLLPVIAEIKAALGAAPGCRIAAMSGSGPTCFGIFTDAQTAQGARRAIARSHPAWWVQTAHLG